MGREGRIKDALEKRPYHELIHDDLYKIADRIRGIDNGYFVLRHTQSGKYEVHNTNNTGSTYCFLVPYDQLDKRTLMYCRETAVHRDIADIIEKQNQRIEKINKRRYQSDMNDRIEHVAEMEQFAVNEDLLHEGYRNVHYMTRG
jgi:hypothetical protein